MKINNDLERYWNKNYNKLRIYQNQFGNCNIPIDYKDLELTKWVNIIRNSYIQIPTDFLKKLHQIGFDFNYNEDAWDKMYLQLKQFRKEHKHIYISSRDKNHSELYSWIRIQIGNKDYLSSSAMKKLELLGVDFENQLSQRQRFEKIWNLNYQQVAELKEKFGGMGLNFQGAFKNNRQLNHWLSRQRRKFHSNKLSKEQIQRLEKLGVEWKPKETAFDKFYKDLKDYIKKNGCLPTITKNKTLWIRIAYYRGKEGKAALTKENNRLLEELGVNKVKKKNWMKYYKKLLAFKKKYGTTYIRQNQDKKLRSWVEYYRGRKHKLPENKRKLLDSINFCWFGETTIRKTCFEVTYLDIKAFYEEHGRLPSKRKESSLHSRMRYLKKIKLSKEEKNKLEKLGIFVKSEKRKVTELL